MFKGWAWKASLNQNKLGHHYSQMKSLAVRPDPHNPGGMTRRVSSGPVSTPTFGMNFKGYAAVRDSSHLPGDKRRSGRGGDEGWGDDGPVRTPFYETPYYYTYGY